MKRFLLGIDVGSTTAKIALVDGQKRLRFAEYRRHFAEQGSCVRDLLTLVAERFPDAEFKTAICGSGARPIAQLLGVELRYWLFGALAVSEGTPYGPLAILAASITLAIWPIRLVSRSLMSHLHLRLDAEQRVTMAHTFLALSRSDEGFEEADRRLILETLFRPTSSGIVRDDGLPNTTQSLLSRYISG